MIHKNIKYEFGIKIFFQKLGHPFLMLRLVINQKQDHI